MFEADIKDGTDCAEMLRTVVYANLTLTRLPARVQFQAGQRITTAADSDRLFVWGARRFALRWCPRSLIADEVFALSKVGARFLWPMSKDSPALCTAQRSRYSSRALRAKVADNSRKSSL
jgi:hypothetical protein